MSATVLEGLDLTNEDWAGMGQDEKVTALWDANKKRLQQIQYLERENARLETVRANLVDSLDTVKGEVKAMVGALDKLNDTNAKKKKAERALGPVVTHAKGVLAGLSKKRSKGETPTY